MTQLFEATPETWSAMVPNMGVSTEPTSPPPLRKRRRARPLAGPTTALSPKYWLFYSSFVFKKSFTDTLVSDPGLLSWAANRNSPMRLSSGHDGGCGA